MESSSIPIIVMLIKSGPFARFILLLISFFSIISIAIIILKVKSFRALLSKNRLFLRKFNSSEKFSEVVLNPDKNSCGSLENVCRTGITEFNRLLETVLTHNRGKVNTFFIESQFSIIKDQVEKVASEEAQKSDRYLVLLAITGSTCPLLGLLGTVWGIMRAFAEIGLRGSASLSVVAPGIAEALITTIWGIAVAIPAIIAYNYFANKSRNFEDETFNFSALLLNKVKIDFFELVYKREESGDS